VEPASKLATEVNVCPFLERDGDDERLKNVLSFSAGMLVAFLLFIIGYRLVFPALCAEDGMLWAAWGQVIVVAVAAALAAYLAPSHTR
jgi:hypothetical protein